LAYKVIFTKTAEKQMKNIRSAKLGSKLLNLLKIVEENPFEPPYEALIGDLKGAFSRRINYQHRLVYRVDEENLVVWVESVWSYYDY